jgi:hypothetical protein
MNKRPYGHAPLAVAAVLSIGTTLLADLVLERLSIATGTLRLLVAISPLPFFFLFIFAEFRWIREQDEFHRRVLLDSLAIAFPLVIAEAVTLDALQSAGFLTHFGIGRVWPFMALTWVPCLWIAVRRYR